MVLQASLTSPSLLLASLLPAAISMDIGSFDGPARDGLIMLVALPNIACFWSISSMYLSSLFVVLHAGSPPHVFLKSRRAPIPFWTHACCICLHFLFSILFFVLSMRCSRDTSSNRPLLVCDLIGKCGTYLALWYIATMWRHGSDASVGNIQLLRNLDTSIRVWEKR